MSEQVGRGQFYEGEGQSPRSIGGRPENLSKSNLVYLENQAQSFSGSDDGLSQEDSICVDS